MTNKELINQLSNYPNDTKVIVMNIGENFEGE